jgi:predicted membrane channel-forming protein YqfA (hemolysin III family)
MTHAAQTFGIEQAHKQMGWWYFIWEGLSYISGAIIYAVSMLCNRVPTTFTNTVFSCACRRDFVPASLTFGVARTRFFIFALSVALRGI